MEMASFAAQWRHLAPQAKLEIFTSSPKEIQAKLASEWQFQARPEQYLPTEDIWTEWLFLGGFGSGKTWTGAHFIVDGIVKGECKRPMLVGRTAADIRDTMVQGPSGILAIAKKQGIEAQYEPSKRRVVFPHQDAYCITYSAAEPDQLRGPEHDRCWADEQCSWPNALLVYQFIKSRLRIGIKPVLFSSTTPELNDLLKVQISSFRNAIVKNSEVIITNEVTNSKGKIWVSASSTYSNRDNLSEGYIESLESQWGGTLQGKRVIEGRILLETPGALWTHGMIKRMPCPEDLSRTIIAVDPAITSKSSSDETGIIVVAKGKDGFGYVLADLSCKKSPDAWARVVIDAYKNYNADRVVAESNQGGDMVETLLKGIDPNVSYKPVWATKGKKTRAEPVAALYEQNKVFHASYFRELEDQMQTYNPETFSGSPDRLDALVNGLTELFISCREPKVTFL